MNNPLEGADFTFSKPLPEGMFAVVGEPVPPDIQGEHYEIWKTARRAEDHSRVLQNSYSDEEVVISAKHIKALRSGMVAVIPINGGEYNLRLRIKP